MELFYIPIEIHSKILVSNVPKMHHVLYRFSPLPSGIYMYRLQTNEYFEMRKMLLIE